LLLFKKPELGEYKQEESQEEGEGDEEEVRKEREDMEERKGNDHSLWTTLRLNFSDIQKGLPMQTRDEKEEEYKRFKDSIIKAKIQRRKDIINKYSPQNFHQHKKDFGMILLHSTYWLIFILIVILQMKNSDIFNQSEISNIITKESVSGKISRDRIEQATGEKPKDISFNFFQISETPEVFDWITEISDLFLVKEGAIINHHNYLFGEPRVSISVRKLKSEENKNPKTKDVIPDSLGSEEYTDPITFGLNNDVEITHTPSGNTSSPRKQGGYVFMIEGGSQTFQFEIFEVYKSNILSKEWVVVIMEFIYCNPNNEYIVLNQAIFK